MLKNQEVLSQLKFDSELNIAKAVKWADDELNEMMATYEQARAVAKETQNTELLLIMNEKVSQLEIAVEFKKLQNKKPSISINQPTA